QHALEWCRCSRVSVCGLLVMLLCTQWCMIKILRKVHQQILTFVNAESDSRSEQLDALRSLVRKLESIGELERLFLQLHRLRVMTETLSSKER
ncbi:unnamed protein product, partial [Effrenium voratum]